MSNDENPVVRAVESMPEPARSRIKRELAEAWQGGVAAEPPPPVAVTPLNTDPQLLDKLFERMTRSNAQALADRPLFYARTLTFTVSGADCAPGVFVDAEGLPFDFKVTMKALNSEEEIKALSSAPPGHGVPLHLTKTMLYQVNGTVIRADQREFFWEALGMQNRALCYQAYMQLSGPSVAALGKFQESISIGSA